MNNISFNTGINRINAVNFKGETSKVENTNLLKKEGVTDTFESKAEKTLTKEDKQEMIQKARTKAAGWSVFGGIFSTMYYGLRSEKTVAKKFDLDAEKDKKLVKQIKREQTLWTLPSVIPGVGGVGAVVAWIYNKNLDTDEIDVK